MPPKIEPKNDFETWVVGTGETTIQAAIELLAKEKIDPDNFSIDAFDAMVTGLKNGMDALLAYGESEMKKTDKYPPQGPVGSDTTNMEHKRNAAYLQLIGAACVYLRAIYHGLFQILRYRGKSPRVVAYIRNAFRAKLVSNPDTAFWKEMLTLEAVLDQFPSNSLTTFAFRGLKETVDKFAGASFTVKELADMEEEDKANAAKAYDDQWDTKTTYGLMKMKAEVPSFAPISNNIAAQAPTQPTPSASLRGVFSQ
jgi:hypothetical protein